MKNINEIDKNFKAAQIANQNLSIYDVEQAPFSLHGLMKEEGRDNFMRMPSSVAEHVNPGVKGLNFHTSGGRVRFRTNSRYIALRYVLPGAYLMPHMPFSGASCFDLYADGRFFKAFIPDASEVMAVLNDADSPRSFEGIVDFGDRNMRNVVINFPLYQAVSKVYIGLDRDAEVLSALPYRHQKPVVFYGSSITQGGCASRPGNAYPNLLSRRLDFDFLNLGFSGNALGEQTMAEYIANLDMSVFVYDYDHNAPTVEHLAETHYAMYETIRKEKPNLPIIVASRPNLNNDLDIALMRQEVIKESLQRAKEKGDNNIYFVNGLDEMFYRIEPDVMTVDGCHPNDFGFYCMAMAFEDLLQKVL